METGPKYERLKRTIKQNLRDGIWKPGGKLPSEKLLCERFGVSKITVKKAKDELIAEGVLETLAGRKGVFIRKLPGISPGSFVGIVVGDIIAPPFLEMFKGIEDKLWEEKLHAVLGNYSSDVEKIEHYIQSLSQGNIIGVILAPIPGHGFQKNNQHILDLLLEQQIPYVLVDRYLPGCLYSSVVSDNRQASKKLILSLLAKGHTRILALASAECSSIDEREQGYLDAFREGHIECDPKLLIRVNESLLADGEESSRHEMERVTRMVEKAGDFTACYFMNSPVQAFIPALLSVDTFSPETVEFVTYDHPSEKLRSLTKRVAVVKQPGYKMGWEAAKLLIKAIRDPEQGIVQMTLRSEIIEQVIE